MGSIVAVAAVAVAPVAAAQEAAEPSHLASGLWIATLAVLAAGALWLAWRIDAIRPGSLDRARRADAPLRADAVIPLLALAFAVFLLPQLVGGAILSAVGGLLGDGSLRDAGQTAAAFYGPGLAASIAAIWFARRRKLLPRGRLTLAGSDPLRGLIAFALAAPVVWAVSSAAAWVAHATGVMTESPIQHGTLRQLVGPDARSSPWWWLVLGGAVIGAPVLEEVVFRGFLQPALVGVLRSRWIAVAISAALFTAMHIPTGGDNAGASWLAIPTIAALAVALGIAMERTGRLGTVIVMHAAFNAANVALAFAVSPG